ncbi:hypothetical protein VMCG_05991 [Cytospora schulzeri]|uniref:N-acetyltransferase domain-containing protein n=1 Tax=Cytospora schulzeri TaxID=448051 RepID=A0A423WCW4_9PEZI|nr:hypothetical protein VMCG_05991 [Valsa malicola]
MVLKMLPAGEADMYRSAVIKHEAYAPAETNRVLFPGPFPPNILELGAEELKEQAKEPNIFCFKVIDTELEGEQMISFSKWAVYDDDHPPKVKPPSESPPGANAEACNLLFGSLKELSDRSIGGRNVVYLQSLHTDPKHQRRGAASMLVSWGVEEAARRDLPAYLESSEAAHNLYLKHQFQDMEELVLDFSKWGVEKPHRTWAMIRVQGGESA